MVYTPTNWKTGDTITAEKLNKLEGAVADFLITVTQDEQTSEYVCDKTYEEIASAYNKGSRVWVDCEDLLFENPYGGSEGYINCIYPTLIGYSEENNSYSMFVHESSHTVFDEGLGGRFIDIWDLSVTISASASGVTVQAYADCDRATAINPQT